MLARRFDHFQPDPQLLKLFDGTELLHAHFIISNWNMRHFSVCAISHLMDGSVTIIWEKGKRWSRDTSGTAPLVSETDPSRYCVMGSKNETKILLINFKQIKNKAFEGK